MTWLAVALGAAIGAVLRDVLQRRLNARTPWGTLAANLFGAFLLGLAVSLQRHGHISANAELFVGVGFCGSLTTWSGVMWEWRKLGTKRGASYIGGSLALGIALAGLGLALG